MDLQRRLVVICAGGLTISVSLCWVTCAFEDKPAADNEVTRTLPGAFHLRVSRTKEGLAAAGGTEESERAVAAALNWLARHQNTDGSWSC